MSDIAGNLRALIVWAPVLQLLSKLSVAKDAAQRAEIVIDLLKAMALRTATPVDDAFLARLDAVLRTAEGAALFDYLFSALSGMEMTNV